MKKSIVILLGFLIALGFTAPANAASTKASAPATSLGYLKTEYGGTTQSTDPTKPNYVPPTGGISVQSATGVGTTSAFKYEAGGLTISVPSGTITHTANGNGLKIDSENAQWQSIQPVPVQMCNYQWQFQNRLGTKIYSTVYSNISNGCAYLSTPLFRYNSARYVKQGQLCARFIVNGTFRGEQCHNVYPG